MSTLPDFSPIAAHFADSSRARIFAVLVDGRAHAASDLARQAGVSASTASGHLARLCEAGLLEVETSGRHRWFRIVDDRVAAVCETLLALCPEPSPRGLSDHTRHARLRVARTCYDHLAGALGTTVMAGLIELDALERTDGRLAGAPAEGDAPASACRSTPYRLGPAAAEVFGGVGIDPATLASGRRPAIRICVDWTEHRHHLGGALGARILDAFVARGWVRRRADRRDLAVDEPAAIERWLTTGR